MYTCNAVGVVVGQSPDGNNSYLLQDANRSVESIPREDIITDQDDAQRLLEVRRKGNIFIPCCACQVIEVPLLSWEIQL